MTTLLLLSEDLIAPYRRHQRVLAPEEIPIHPAVHDAPFAFTPDFMNEVKQGTLATLQRDVSEIERLLGIPLGLEVTEQAIRGDMEETRLDSIRFHVDPARKELYATIMATTTGILAHRPGILDIDTRDLSSLPDLKHPLPLDKAERYMFRRDGSYLQLHSWYTHNIHDQGETFFHYLRAFAITFNNHGLVRLGRE